MTDQDICPRCGGKPYPGCGGKGFIQVTEDHARGCPHLKARRLRDHLGLEIATVKHVSSSPLFEMSRTPGEPPVVDRTGDNLKIHVHWQALLPHLKLALGCKGDQFLFKIITDQLIKNVYVGNETYRNRPASIREKEPTYNSLNDLMGKADLLIIKLGYLGYKNAAAPGGLHEGLMIREDLNLPTWLVVDPYFDWSYSNHPTVERYIDQRYEVVEIEAENPYTGERVDLDESLGLSVHEDEREEELFQEEPSEVPCETPTREDYMEPLSLPSKRDKKRPYRRNS